MKKYIYASLFVFVAHTLQSMQGMFLINGKYCLEIKDGTLNAITKVLSEDNSCDICLKENGDTLWYGRRTFAHQACIDILKPHEKIFKRIAHKNGLLSGTALYALSHTRTFNAVQSAFRPGKISLLQYAQGHSENLKKLLLQLAPLFIQKTIESRDEIPEWPIYKALTFVKEKKEPSKVLRLSQSVLNLIRNKPQENPLPLPVPEPKKEKEKGNEH